MSVAGFARAVGADDVQLAEACFALSSALHRPFDTAEPAAELERLAAGCPTRTPQGVAQYLFGDLGFAGNSVDYYDWHNSCLDRVISTRVGIPISLSVLMIEVGRQVGVELVGIGMPTHFLVGTGDGPARYFDPFRRGRELDADGARELFEGLTRQQVRWQPSFLTPTSPHQIVTRILNNLRAIFQGRSDQLRLGIVLQMLALVPGVDMSATDEYATATALFN